jgi:hypothetical protein
LSGTPGFCSLFHPDNLDVSGYNTVVHSIRLTHPLFYKMADSKIYLNVPFTQKDEAKALGARWDAVLKKWFAKWQAASDAVESPRSKASSTKVNSSSKKADASVKTHATVKDFVAYNGDTPPWD